MVEVVDAKGISFVTSTAVPPRELLGVGVVLFVAGRTSTGPVCPVQEDVVELRYSEAVGFMAKVTSCKSESPFVGIVFPVADSTRARVLETKLETHLFPDTHLVTSGTGRNRVSPSQRKS